jgi:HPt (histidine-containing phosphotransfer) domain-containing protein
MKSRPAARAPAATSDGPPAIDEAHLRELEALFEGTPGGFYTEMLQPYVDVTRRRVQDVEQALAREDASAAGRVAHTIKGSSLNLGFAAVGRAAAALEAEAARADRDHLAALARQLSDELERAASLAERYRAPVATAAGST